MIVRVRVEPGISTAATDNGELIVISEATGKLHQCNATAADMWRALVVHEGDVRAAALAVATRHDVEVNVVQADLDALVGKLSLAGLVKVVS